jgi:hypothetical protein
MANIAVTRTPDPNKARGGYARAKKLTAAQRSQSAKNAADTRWEEWRKNNRAKVARAK